MSPQELRLSARQAGNEILGRRPEKPVPISVEKAPLLRLQEAGIGGRRVEPDAVLAVLADIAAGQVANVQYLQGKFAELMEMLFADASPSPAATMALIERLSGLHLRHQAQAERTLALLYQLAAPPAPPVVNILAVGKASRRTRRSSSSRTRTLAEARSV
jgi:hypothetical protein